MRAAWFRNLAASAALVLCVSAAPPAAAFAPGPNWATPASLPRQVLGYVQRLYVEPDRVDPAALVDSALRSLEREYPAVIVELPGGGAPAVISVNGARRTLDLSGAATIDGAIAVLEQAIAVLAEGDMGPGASPEDAARAALRGALATLDPHTQIFSPAQVKEFQSQTRGTFGGVGFVFTMTPGGILVGEVLPGTPAERAGLRPGDLIVEVDGLPVAGLASVEVSDLVRGEPGTSVVLGLAPAAGGAPRPVTAVRAIVTGRSVRSALVGGAGAAPVLHATVERFQADTAAQLRAALDRPPRTPRAWSSTCAATPAACSTRRSRSRTSSSTRGSSSRRASARAPRRSSAPAASGWSAASSRSWCSSTAAAPRPPRWSRPRCAPRGPCWSASAASARARCSSSTRSPTAAACS